MVAGADGVNGKPYLYVRLRNRAPMRTLGRPRHGAAGALAGEPKPGTEQVLAALQSVLARDLSHPGAYEHVLSSIVALGPSSLKSAPAAATCSTPRRSSSATAS